MYIMGETSEFVSKKAIAEFFGLPRWITSILMQTMKINKLNRFVASLRPYEGTVEMLQKAIIALNITEHFDINWIDELKGKPYITISNHVWGLLDGIAFTSHIGTKTPRYRITANYLLSSINSVKNFMIPVNPYEQKGNKKSKRLGGTQRSLDWIGEGGSVGLFPAGDVATKFKGSKEITEGEWKTSSFRLIRLAKIPVVPIYIEGTNSRWFHFVGKIHPRLRTFRMVKEFFNKKNSTITIRPGKIVYPEEYLKYETDQELRDFLRNEVFKLKKL